MLHNFMIQIQRSLYLQFQVKIFLIALVIEQVIWEELLEKKVPKGLRLKDLLP